LNTFEGVWEKDRKKEEAIYPDCQIMGVLTQMAGGKTV